MSPPDDVDIESLFKNNRPIVQDVGMDGRRATEPLAPCVRHDLKCPDCSENMVLRKSETFKRLFYSCSDYPRCRGAVGAHPDGRPKGVPGNQKTKEARSKAFAVFERIWERKRLTRPEAYGWMRQILHLPGVVEGEELNIGHLTAEQCEKLIQAVKKSFPETRTVWEKLREHSKLFNTR